MPLGAAPLGKEEYTVHAHLRPDGQNIYSP